MTDKALAPHRTRLILPLLSIIGFPGLPETLLLYPYVTMANKLSIFRKVYQKVIDWWLYCSKGVWSDPRHNWHVKIIKVLNLSVNSFFDRGLQIKAMALTYSTILSLVPAIALIVAIGRGFGLQDSLQNELYILFPSQRHAIATFLSFVDSYLNSASQGLFVGIGLIVLLWTVFSLLSYIEDAFNSIWDVKHRRTIFRKFTDYIAICLLVPILLICASGVSVFMSSTVQNVLFLPLLTPVVNVILDLAPIVLAWLAFTFSYFLIPNTRISFKYAAISGLFAALGFSLLQWLFLTGQIYVSKYNAIYGSFAFLPLLLIWLQLTWLLILTGCLLTYSQQNVMTFNFFGNVDDISISTRQKAAVILMAIVAREYDNRKTPLSKTEIAAHYGLPIKMVNNIVSNLMHTGLLCYVSRNDGTLGVSPAYDITDMTVADVIRLFDSSGSASVSPDFDRLYAAPLAALTPTLRLLDINL